MTLLRPLLAILSDFAGAVMGIPSEVNRWWHEGHTRTAWLRENYDDYMLWRMLGKVSDALLLAIILTIGILIGLAF